MLSLSEPILIPSLCIIYLSLPSPVVTDDISHALSKLTEPTAVPIPKLSVSNMVHSARKRIRRHRRVDESPLSNDVLNSILLVRGATHRHTHSETQYKQCISSDGYARPCVWPAQMSTAAL
jgi:hypothetical protein